MAFQVFQVWRFLRKDRRAFFFFGLSHNPSVQDVAVVLLLGMIPLLWFREFVVLKTEDLMLPPNWHEFGIFWFTWNEELGLGAERILDSGRFVTLVIAALLQHFGASVVVGQAAQFVVWFTLPGLGMYWLMRAIVRGPYARASCLTAVFFYMFNLWILSNWMGYKEPLIAGVAILPFALGIWIRTFQQDGGYLRAAVATALVSLAAAPMGNNITEMLAVAAVLPIVFVVFLVKCSVRGEWSRAARVVVAGMGTAVVWGIINLFWIAPMVGGVSRAASGDDIATFKQISVQFLEGQSLYTPLSNVVRILGDWTFYQGLVDPYRTFSATFVENPLFIVLGYGLTGLVLVGALWGRGISKGSFVMLAGLGVVLSAGLNAPWGGAYAWAFENVPGGWIVRSPWFKFMLWTVIGYAVLIGLATPIVAGVVVRVFTYARQIRNDQLRRASTALAVGIAIVVGPVYAYPIALGHGFATADERAFLTPNHAHIPPYVDEAGSWFDKQEGNARIMTVPGDAPWLYNWGYGGFGSVLQWRTRHPVLYRHTPDALKVSQGAPDSSGPITNQLDKDLLDARSGTVATTLARLGVGWVQHERDVRWDFYKGMEYREDDSPERVSNILEARDGIEPVVTFGAWDVYRVDDPMPQFWAASSLLEIQDLDARLASRIFGSGWVDRTPLVAEGDALSVVHSRFGGAKPVISILDTEKLVDAPSGVVDGIEIRIGRESDWGARERMPDGGFWRWFRNGSPRGEHYIVSNPEPYPSAVELRMQVMSYRSPRDFFLYVNDELVLVEPVVADQPTEIQVPGVWLNPGPNVIAFYTPYGGDSRNGESVAFAISEHPSFVRSVFTWRSDIPVSGEYEAVAIIDPLPPDDAGVSSAVLSFNVDGQEVSLEETPSGSGRFTGTIPLQRNARLMLQQQGQEQYVVLFRSVDQAADYDGSAAKIDVIARDPTRYRLNVRALEPFVLVMNAAHHEGWNASINGRILPHGKVDTYANAYLVDQTGTFEIDVAFGPQQTFRIAMAVSGVAAVVSLGTLVVLRRRRH